MARKVIDVTIDADNRDAGKVFQITEMSADQAERWAIRAFFAMSNSGLELPDGIAESGMAGIAAIGLKSLGKVPFEQAEPLLDEMMQCVKVKPSKNVVRDLVDDDIEEVSTRLKLRTEVFKLHVNFSIPESTTN